MTSQAGSAGAEARRPCHHQERWEGTRERAVLTAAEVLGNPSSVFLVGAGFQPPWVADAGQESELESMGAAGAPSSRHRSSPEGRGDGEWLNGRLGKGTLGV